jgi:hypothetical protein
MMRVGVFIGCVLAAGVAPRARGQEPPTVIPAATRFAASGPAPLAYRVHARFDDPSRRSLRFVLDLRLRRPPGATGARLWWPATRIETVPSAVDERNWRWVFPGEADRGAARLISVEVAGIDVTHRVEERPVPDFSDVAGSDLLVPLPAGAGEVTVRLRGQLTLPERFGRLGGVDDARYLLSPWYPILVDEAGHHRFVAVHEVVVDGPGAFELVVGGTRCRPGRPCRVRGAYAPVAVAPRFRERQRRVGPTVLRVYSADGFYDPPPPDARGLDALDDLVAIDQVGLLEEALGGVPATLTAVGERVPGRVDVLVFPSRTELAATAPGVVLVSDRIFQVFPFDVVRAFHERRFRRAVFRQAVAPEVDRVEALRDRAWVADLRAQVLADLDQARREGSAKSPEELLSFAAFHPSVDNLLYARQVPFLDVYFDQGTGADPFREDPDQARHPRPRARKLLGDVRLGMEADAREESSGVPPRDEPQDVPAAGEGAVPAAPSADGGAGGAGGERAGGQAYGRFVAAVARGERPVRGVLSALSPATGAALDDWLRPRPVNYRLGAVESEALPAGGYRHQVEVLRDGDPSPEPVAVRLTDQEGNAARAVFRAPGHRGRVTLSTPAPVDRVVIDPEGHAEQDPELTGGHPRDDDATSWPLRPPLLQSFGLSFSAADQTVQGFVTFALRRLYDLESIWQLTLFVEPGSQGGVARYIRGIGPKRHGNARVGFASVGLDLSRLEEGFAGAEQGGWRFGLNAGAGVDRRVFLFDPRQGVNASIGGRVGGVQRDDGELVWTGALTGRAGVTLGLGYRTALFLVGEAGWTFGDPLETELQRIGGLFGLRGYQIGDVVGEGRLAGIAELRYTLLTDLALNALHLAWVRELQVALFAGGGGLFQPTRGDAELFGLADVGLGFRWHVEYGGVQPGVVAIDLAWPLADVPGRQGLLSGQSAFPNVYFYFNQYL